MKLRPMIFADLTPQEYEKLKAKHREVFGMWELGRWERRKRRLGL